MKHQFYFSSLREWFCPLDVFPKVEDETAQLFYSGKGGRYSFLPYEGGSIRDVSYVSLQNEYASSLENKDISSLSDWGIPFTGGLVGVWAYEYALRFFPEFKNIEHRSIDVDSVNSPPLFSGGIYTHFVCFDHQEKKVFLAGWFPSQEKFEVWKENATKKIYTSPKNIFSGVSTSILQEKNIVKKTVFTPELSLLQYKKKFDICQKELQKGNSFQINFSQQFSASSKLSSWEIFVLAAKKNPAPMMYYSHVNNTPHHSIISCSPERLFSADTLGNIFTQPIAGTRKRGTNLEEDQQLEKELITSKKEISEHSMLVDLLRNDFGKVSQYGSVQVSNFARIEKYTTVMHLVSDIVGKIDTTKNVFDVFEAVFPGGTITGAPKHETMKILCREEECSRDFYCGSAGYISFSGAADFNILIRTLEKRDTKLSGRAGGGLVYGADSSFEYQECLNKFSGIEKIFDIHETELLSSN